MGTLSSRLNSLSKASCLPGCSATNGDLIRLLTSCIFMWVKLIPVLNLIKFLFADLPPLLEILKSHIYSIPPSLVQFILDLSTDPNVLALYQTSNIDVLDLTMNAFHDWI